ncbi:ACP phosphodiesterase [Hahella aquimaris]|uniref:acyl carrier protein phosphodiesterase n=1 Tax=Hahella sp. HNIBRBA332 TaxID=3015983 RepID=UPI00273BE225|nr:ACP phosphodiesterase [Hahella sp. HNIBRBA332]WLQ12542.1 ACP phosphodiesterase [Hahella sp. HNIBRBA332]
MADVSATSFTGAFLGDFVKGAELHYLPASLATGIRLHRAIDLYTDNHVLVKEAMALISPYRRRFAGIIVDVAFDHFLARSWRDWYADSLEEFAVGVYASLQEEYELMPPRAQRTVLHMSEHDWLNGYAHLSNIHRSLDNIAARLSRRTTMYGSGEEVELHYQALEVCFMDFYPQLLAYVEGVDTNSF